MSKRVPVVGPIIQSAEDQFSQDFGHGPLNALFNLATGGVPGATHAVAGDYGPTARQGAIDAGLIAATIASAGALGGASAAGAGAADTTAAGADASLAGADAAAADSALATSGGATAAGAAGSGGATALDTSALAGGATSGGATALDTSALAGGAGTGGTTALDAAALSGTGATPATAALPAASSPTAATPNAATPSLMSRIMTSLGIGPSSTTPATEAGTPFTALSPDASAELTSTNPALTASLQNAVPADAGGGGGPLSAITGFTQAHPILTAGGSLALSQILSPLLQKLQGSGMTSQEKALLAAQQPVINTEQQLLQSETTGVLPPGAEASVEQALQSDIANIRSRYAAMGMSGSSAEAQDIANAQQAAAGQKFSIAQQATQSGLSAAGITSDVYNTLIQDQLSRQQELQNAFSGFFNAVGLGTALAGSKAA